MKKYCIFAFLALALTACGGSGEVDEQIKADEEEVIQPEKPDEGDEEDENEEEDGEENETPLPGETTTLPPEVDLENGWVLAWSDEFDYPDEQLDENWKSQNGLWAGGVISSRWRDNAVVRDGVLHLEARKESRGGAEWTTGNIWTKKTDFFYGYYEAKYKYAAATGLNNAFWFWNSMDEEYPYELDVNEGHFPNIINTNRHYRFYEPGAEERSDWSESIQLAPGSDPHEEPFHSVTYEKPIKASKLRFKSDYIYYFSIGEFRIFEPSAAGYPKNVRSDEAENEIAGLVNIARDKNTKISANGYLPIEGRVSEAEYVADGKISNSWTTADIPTKILEFDFGREREIGNIQFDTGWLEKNKPGWESGVEHWRKIVSEFEIEYFDGETWHTATDFDLSNGVDLAAEYHVYGMWWDENKVIYYFDGKPIRTMHFDELPAPIRSPQTMYLSLAVLDKVAGPVTDEIDGTSMKVDYVRYYKKVE